MRSILRRIRLLQVGAACAAMLLLGTTRLAAARSLRDVLTPEEFQRAGLAKLSAEELEYLSARLLGDSPAPAVTASEPAAAVAPAPEAGLPRGEAAFGHEEKLRARAEAAQRVPSAIESRIAGRFHGWDGHTTFTLANGQVWRQAEPAEFVAELDEPVVTIRKGLFGVYYLRVAGYGSQVKVQRVR